MIVTGSTRLVGYVNITSTAALKRKARCPGEGNFLKAPKANWLSKECGSLHNEELVLVAGARSRGSGAECLGRLGHEAVAEGDRRQPVLGSRL